MNKFAIDYSLLEQELDKPKIFRYADVKDRLVRVAYDVVRFQAPEEDIDGLWQIQTTDDGEVIVAMYEEGDTKIAEASRSRGNWQVVSDSGNNMHIFYKDHFVKRMASVENAAEIAKIACDKLNSSPESCQLLVAELPSDQKEELFRKYPELSASK